MASPELRRLWKLHQVDSGLVEVRHRAAALDPGRQIMAELKALEKQQATDGAAAKALHAEQLDIELAQKSIDDKLKKIDSEIYGGKVVNPREIDALEREVVILKKKRSDYDDRLLELMDLLPPAKELSDKIDRAIAIRRKALAEKQKAAMAEKAVLEARYAELNKQRPELAKAVPPDLLTRYEATRKRTDGTGMAEIVAKKTCGSCGMQLPERVIVSAAEDRLTTCEACHRILYYTEGVV